MTQTVVHRQQIQASLAQLQDTNSLRMVLPLTINLFVLKPLIIKGIIKEADFLHDDTMAVINNKEVAISDVLGKQKTYLFYGSDGYARVVIRVRYFCGAEQ